MRRHLAWIHISLQLALVLSGTVVVARAVFGPFRFLVSVRNPIGAETVFGTSAVLLLILAASIPRPRESLETSGDRNVSCWLVAASVAFAAAAWAWSFRFPFIADDYVHTFNALHRSPGYIASLFTVSAADSFFRPFVYIAYAVEGLFVGSARAGWHAFSFGLHAITGLLVYRIARKMRIGGLASLAAMLFFQLHGSRPEAVAWLSAQFDIWAALFVLAAFAAFLEYRDTGRTRWQILSLMALFCGLLSKESAYIYPLILITWLILDRVQWKRAVMHATLPLVLTATVFVYRERLLGGIGGYRDSASDTTFFLNLSLFRTPKGLFARSSAIAFFPLNWSSPFEWWLICAIAALVIAVAIVAIRQPLGSRISSRGVAFGVIFFLIAALPVHLFLLIDQDLEKSRVLYLPMAGAAFALGSLLDAMKKPWALGLAAAVLLFQFASLEHNLRIWNAVAHLAESTCRDAAQIATSAPGPVGMTGIPNVVDGVYFLHTGFRKCVEQAAGREDLRMITDTDVLTALETPRIEASEVTQSYEWSTSSRKIVLASRN